MSPFILNTPVGVWTFSLHAMQRAGNRFGRTPTELSAFLRCSHFLCMVDKTLYRGNSVYSHYLIRGRDSGIQMVAIVGHHAGKDPVLVTLLTTEIYGTMVSAVPLEQQLVTMDTMSGQLGTDYLWRGLLRKVDPDVESLVPLEHLVPHLHRSAFTALRTNPSLKLRGYIMGGTLSEYLPPEEIELLLRNPKIILKHHHRYGDDSAYLLEHPEGPPGITGILHPGLREALGSGACIGLVLADVKMPRKIGKGKMALSVRLRGSEEPVDFVYEESVLYTPKATYEGAAKLDHADLLELITSLISYEAKVAYVKKVDELLFGNICTTSLAMPTSLSYITGEPAVVAQLVEL